MPPEDAYLSPLIADINDLQAASNQHSHALAALEQGLKMLHESNQRVTQSAQAAFHIAKVVRQMLATEYGEDFETAWAKAQRAAFPPPEEQKAAEFQKALEQVRKETQQQIAGLRSDVETTLNTTLQQIMDAVQQQGAVPPGRVSPVPEEEPTPAPKPKPKPKPRKKSNSPSPRSQENGVDADDAV